MLGVDIKEKNCVYMVIMRLKIYVHIVVQTHCETVVKLIRE